MSLCVFTIVARNYLPLAYTLADSVREHTDTELLIFVADGTEALPDKPERHRLVSLDTYLGAGFDELRFKYNVTEFCTSVKPHLFKRLLAETDAQYVYYLDPDTRLYGRLDSVHAEAPQASLYLTPHLLHCRTEPDHAYPEYKHLWEGIFNLGFCGVRRSAPAEALLDWWHRRLVEQAYADRFDGLHTDQKWLDYAPCYLGDALHIVRHPGVNVAHWNLDERQLGLASQSAGYPYEVAGQPLLLFHFSGFDFRGGTLTRHVDVGQQQRYAGQALEQLTAEYRAAVIDNGYARHIVLPYLHGRYDNGIAVTPLHRRLYRAKGGATWHDRPFTSTGPVFEQFRERGLLDDSPAAARDHAAATLPGLDRLTRVAQWLLRAFLRCFGARRYAYLLKFFYKYARPEFHAFLLEGRQQANNPAPRP